MAVLIYRRTVNLRAVQLLFGHSKIESTVRYLGIDVDDAIEIAEKIDVPAIPQQADVVGGASRVADRHRQLPLDHAIGLQLVEVALREAQPVAVDRRIVGAENGR